MSFARAKSSLQEFFAENPDLGCVGVMEVRIDGLRDQGGTHPGCNSEAKETKEHIEAQTIEAKVPETKRPKVIEAQTIEAKVPEPEKPKVIEAQASEEKEFQENHEESQFFE
jgi:hypothetical protein